MFAALVRDRNGLAPELSDVRRFHSVWEQRASVELRAGSEEAIDAYEAHDRIVSGARDEMLDAIFAAWKHDIASGRTSLMIAGDLGTVSELNARARADRISAGQVIDEGVTVAGGGTAGVGDQVRTRQNNRRLTSGRTWVRNGDRWTVIATFEDGAMTVTAGERCRRGAPAGRLRARPRRAGLRLDRASGARSDRRYRARHRLTHDHARSALRLGHQRAGGQLALRRHPLRPRPADLP